MAMSDFSLTLVLQIKTSKIINDMAKVQQKSEKIIAFGGLINLLWKEIKILMKKFCQNCGICGKFITFASDKR